jgi:hypothetical protein
MAPEHEHTPATGLPEAPEWRRATSCTANGDNCVEVRHLPTGTIHLRDSKPDVSGIISVSRVSWTLFVADLRQGSLS